MRSQSCSPYPAQARKTHQLKRNFLTSAGLSPPSTHICRPAVIIATCKKTSAQQGTPNAKSMCFEALRETSTTQQAGAHPLSFSFLNLGSSVELSQSISLASDISHMVVSAMCLCPRRTTNPDRLGTTAPCLQVVFFIKRRGTDLAIVQMT
jgi:hypothetical protein